MAKTRSWSEFIVVGCPYCGKIQVIENRAGIRKKVFKCRFSSCGRTRKMKNKSEWGLAIKVYGASTSAKEMSDLVRKLTDREIGWKKWV